MLFSRQVLRNGIKLHYKENDYDYTIYRRKKEIKSYYV